MADIKQQMEKLIQQGGTAEPPEDGRLFDDTTAGRVEQEREEETGERERAGETAANSSGTDEKEKDGNIDFSRFPNTPIDVQKRYNMQNLVPNSERTPEERRRNASKAGKASAEARRGKKNLQELLNTLLSAPATPEMVARARALGIDAKDAGTLYDAMNVAIIEQALAGNGYAYQLIRDSAGDMPTKKVEQAVSMMTDKDIEMMRKLDARLNKSATDGQK